MTRKTPPKRTRRFYHSLPPRAPESRRKWEDVPLDVWERKTRAQRAAAARSGRVLWTNSKGRTFLLPPDEAEARRKRSERAKTKPASKKPQGGGKRGGRGGKGGGRGTRLPGGLREIPGPSATIQSNAELGAFVTAVLDGAAALEGQGHTVLSIRFEFTPEGAAPFSRTYPWDGEPGRGRKMRDIPGWRAELWFQLRLEGGVPDEESPTESDRQEHEETKPEDREAKRQVKRARKRLRETGAEEKGERPVDVASFYVVDDSLGGGT